MRLMPHDHRMWAVIAVYQGTEDNQFFRRSSDGAEGAALVESNGRRLEAGDVLVLGESTIHAVANPGSMVTGALHVYGGDFVNQPRSQWGPGDGVERPFDLDAARQQFHDANVAAGLA
jgi:predicted metal-dependent enzyme (double-stranded beta helix superfamily)